MTKRLCFRLIALLCLLPFGLMVLSSFENPSGGWGVEQYWLLLKTPRFFTAFWNSFIYTLVIIAFNIPVSLMAAYAFSRFNFKGKWPLFSLFIIIMLLPFQATMVPQYLILKGINVIGSPLAVILPNIFSTFSVFLMAQYMSTFDRRLYEAAALDGLSDWQMLARITVPVCRPIIISTALLAFVNYWSLIEQPSLFLDRQKLMPLSVRLTSADFAAFSGAAGVVFSILPLILFLYNKDEIQMGISNLSHGGDGGKTKGGLRGQKRVLTTFAIAMIVATLVSQKIDGYLLTEVTVYPCNRTAPVLNEYTLVLPESCVADGMIYTVTTDTYDNISIQVEDRRAEIADRQKGYVALNNYLPGDALVVCHRSRDIASGDRIRIVGEAFEK